MFRKAAAFALALTMMCTGLTARADSLNGGDLNSDGEINVTDVVKLAAHVKSIRALDSRGQTRADLNGDGDINVTDFNILAAYVKGISKTQKPAQPSLDDMAEELAKLVNKERRSRGLTAYVYSPELSKAAAVRAKEIASVWDHPRPDGTLCFTAITQAGISYTAAAENIAEGQTTPQMAFDDFMHSTHHRDSMLDPNLTYIGIGVYRQSNGTLEWVQLFANGSGMSGICV